MLLESQTSGKSIDELWKEKLEKALKEDYDNCYTEHYYIQSLPAFTKFVEVVQAYYNKKKEQDKSFTYQMYQRFYQ